MYNFNKETVITKETAANARLAKKEAAEKVARAREAKKEAEDLYREFQRASLATALELIKHTPMTTSEICAQTGLSSQEVGAHIGCRNTRLMHQLNKAGVFSYIDKHKRTTQYRYALLDENNNPIMNAIKVVTRESIEYSAN